MRSPFLQRFRRVTYSTAYLPEVDGLRFLAIFSVVVIMHITSYIDGRFFSHTVIPDGYWKNVVLGGGMGVGLFFVISGFILSLPFARWRLQGEKSVQLSRYYLRRVTRLEPPYLIALLIFFTAQVWILHQYTPDYLLPRLVASAFYLHTVLYDAFSPILPVAWSLEVEVQFYILAPLFFLLFLIPQKGLRWGIYGAVIITSSVFWFGRWEVAHVFMCLHFFFCGILLADLYCSGVSLFVNRWTGLAAGLLSLTGFLLIDSWFTAAGYLGRMICMFVLFHTVLMNPYMKKLFSFSFLSLIGGMCYSIYLLHFAVISLVGTLILKWGIRPGAALFLPLGLLFIVSVLLVSSFYFLLVEKPFMRPFVPKKH